MGSPERESSVKQMIGRVAGTIADWGRDGAYFDTPEDADAFQDELTYILLHQIAAFNSPVWFNVGFEEHPQCSACFILSVEDELESILDWNTREGKIFRGGSGSGINLSKIRSSKEPLSKGGLASGPVSFMRGADAWAGTIKSGGKTRRAAKMVVLDIDHPDVVDFIWCKANEELKRTICWKYRTVDPLTGTRAKRACVSAMINERTAFEIVKPIWPNRARSKSSTPFARSGLRAAVISRSTNG